MTAWKKKLLWSKLLSQERKETDEGEGEGEGVGEERGRADMQTFNQAKTGN